MDLILIVNPGIFFSSSCTRHGVSNHINAEIKEFQALDGLSEGLGDSLNSLVFLKAEIGETIPSKKDYKLLAFSQETACHVLVTVALCLFTFMVIF